MGLRAGDVIGERALFGRQPWPAVYVASSKALALVLDRGSMEKALTGEDDPRGLLEALRADRNDEDVQRAVAKIAYKREDD